jgi:uncharacterized membrane protein
MKPLFSNGFFHDYLNDLICVPFWVPIMLWGMQKLGLRNKDSAPQWYEILIPLLVWSVVFETIVPRMAPYKHLSHADPADILFYTLGAVLASLFWKRWYLHVSTDTVEITQTPSRNSAHQFP